MTNIKIRAFKTIDGASVFHVACPACGHDDFHYPHGRGLFNPGTIADAYYRAEQMHRDHLSYDPDGHRCPVADLIEATRS